MTHVTVIMAARNAEPFIGMAIQSILDQTHKDWDLLVLEGSSTDRTREIAQAFRDPRVRVVARKAQDYAGAMQEGVMLARGPYFAILDADDIALPDRLALQAAALDADDRIAAIGSQSYAFGVDLSPRPMRRPTGHRVLRLALLNDSPMIHPSTMMRLDAVRAVGGYRPGFLFADYDLFVRLAQRGRLANLAVAGLLYRRHSAGISQGRHRRAAYLERATIQGQAARFLGPRLLGALLIMKTRLRAAVTRRSGP